MAELWDVSEKAREVLNLTPPADVLFWRRQNFSARGNYSSNPMWHRLRAIRKPEAKSPHERYDDIYVAFCGYSFQFQGLLGKTPQLRAEVKTKKLRCEKCDKRFEKEQEGSRGTSG